MSDEDSPAILTVFRSRLRSDAEALGYHEVADEMERQARAMPGFLEFKTFTADDGERVSLAMFDSIDNHHRWRDHPAHQTAQQRGRADFYTEYRITVGQVVREISFTADQCLD
ncbi:MAG: antibiotic biosynthesis monooxygenase [Mycobacteriaceae bacterium]